MHFSKITLATAALYSFVLAQGQVKVHVVWVSGTTNKLTFTPNNLIAEVGDMVQFQFGVGNHTVSQSTFDAPCIPMGGTGTNVTAINSGFMPVAADAKTAPVYTVPIMNKTPMWLYCAQGKHCQSGMVMVINENTTKNATRSLNNYIAAAKAAPVSEAPSGSSGGGTSGESPVNSGSGSDSGTGSGSGSGSDTGSGTGSGTGSESGAGAGTGSGSGASNTTVIPSSAGALHAPYLAGLVAIGAAVLL